MVRIRRATLQLEGLTVSPRQARELAERVLARTAAGLAGGATGRIAHLTVEVHPDRADGAALADAIGLAVSAAVQHRLKGG
jgi:hypothetical protein